MNKFRIAFVSLFLSLFGVVFAAPQYLMTQTLQQQTSPQQALEKLKQGNARFVLDKMRHYDLQAIAAHLVSGQYPFAVVLSCIDSRSAPDYTFDQGLGNIFISRIAANVADKNVIAGMEFATKVAGSKLIVVMGHTACGAVIGACNHVTVGNLPHLLSSVQPAVKTIKAKEGRNFSCDNSQTIDAIAKQNVLNQVQFIYQNSKVIRTLIQNHKLMLVGAMHDLATSKVTFFDNKGQAV